MKACLRCPDDDDEEEEILHRVPLTHMCVYYKSLCPSKIAFARGERKCSVNFE